MAICAQCGEPAKVTAPRSAGPTHPCARGISASLHVIVDTSDRCIGERFPVPWSGVCVAVNRIGQLVAVLVEEIHPARLSGPPNADNRCELLNIRAGHFEIHQYVSYTFSPFPYKLLSTFKYFSGILCEENIF